MPNQRGAWWRRGDYDKAVAEVGMVLLRKSLGHDENGAAIAGGAKIAVFRVSSVSSDDDQFSFVLEERIADVE